MVVMRNEQAVVKQTLRRVGGDAQVSVLEEEAQQLRATFNQHTTIIKSLERRVSGLEMELQDHQLQARRRGR